MWIFLNDAMLSVIEHPNAPDTLIVRSRAKEDLEATFPDRVPENTPERDYEWRTYATRKEVAALVAARLESLDYTNFKDSVQQKDRASAYLSVWAAMLGFQRLRNGREAVLSRLAAWRSSDPPAQPGKKRRGKRRGKGAQADAFDASRGPQPALTADPYAYAGAECDPAEYLPDGWRPRFRGDL
jgi:hypothetical protein